MSSGTERVEITDARAREILAHYVADGKLRVIPAKRNAKLVVFEWRARRFELGRRFSEKEVNALIGEAHPDFATLRRGLYDERFVDRADGFYWRTPADQKLLIRENLRRAKLADEHRAAARDETLGVPSVRRRVSDTGCRSDRR